MHSPSCPLGATYAFETGGTFLEAALSRDFEICDLLLFIGEGIFGDNQDYVTDAHDGVDHMRATQEIEPLLRDRIAVIRLAAPLVTVDHYQHGPLYPKIPRASAFFEMENDPRTLLAVSRSNAGLHVTVLEMETIGSQRAVRTRHGKND